MRKKVIFNDVINILPDVIEDKRGSFAEIYNKKKMAELGIMDDFIQDNSSFSIYANTLRGIHFQINPYAQSKLVKVEKGKIFDVFIDLKRNSSNFETYSSCILTPKDGWLYIPKGYAHGFCTLENDTKVIYKVDNYYNKEFEQGLRWNDPFFKINWPIDEKKLIISDKDLELPFWSDIREKIDF
tara:strand:+ start:3815 stop:4366 length:552 start_codon:yes stop_codon:yes gene_type:complete